MKKMLLLVAAVFIGLQLFAQETVSGVVVDELDDAIPGASISIKGTDEGTITNFDGEYTIEVPKDATLIFSFIGCQSQEIVVAGKEEINVTLKLGEEEIEEIVVVAYGTATKKSIVGAQASVTAKEIERRPITNISSALSGAAPGVQVTIGGGQPGSSSSIRIRGFGSMNASSAPIYVVDGSVYNGAISDIPTQDIESVSILKDAASTALYGSSAGNGVVLITTKSGKQAKEGKPIFNFVTHQGISKKGQEDYKKVGPMEYYPLMWQQWYNQYKYDYGYDDELAGMFAMDEAFSDLKHNPYAGLQSVYEQYKENGKYKYRMTNNPNPNNETWPAIVTPDGKLNPEITGLLYEDDLDWEKDLFRTGFRSEYSLNGSYRTDKLKSFMSLGHVNEEGYRIETGMKRYTGRLNLSYNVNKFFNIGTNLSLSSAEIHQPKTSSGSYSSNSFNFVRGIGPIYPIHLHNPDGTYMLDDSGNKIYDFNQDRPYSTRFNPVYESFIDLSTYKRDATYTRTFAELVILPELKLRTNLAYDLYRSSSKTRYNNIMGDQPLGTLSISNYRSSTITLNQLLEYRKTFGKHSLGILAGHESYRYESQKASMKKKGMGILGIDEMDNLIEPSSQDSYTSNYRKEGYLGRITYSFANKYNFSASYRRDATSRLHKDHRWGNFWSAGIGWLIKEEAFLSDVSWIDMLKIRASIGQTGNDAFDSYYAYQTTYGLGNNNNDRPGLRLKSFALQSLTWETQTSYDVALEFGLFQRLRGTVEFFNKESKDLLFAFPLPVSTGIGSIDKNLGKVRNYGLEFSLNFAIAKTNDLKIELFFNGTTYKNEIITLPEENRKDGIISGTKKYMEGKSRYEYYLREWIGVDPEDGLAIYRLDKDEYPDEPGLEESGEKASWTKKGNFAKKHYCGSSIPDLYGGFGTNITCKQIDVSVQFAYQIGGKTYDGAYKGLMGRKLKSGGSMHIDALKAWKKPGDVTDVPRLDAGNSGEYNNYSSDRFLISSDAFMLKSVVVGYTLPGHITERLKLNNVRLSVAAENLYLLSRRKGLNPMVKYHGVTGAAFYDYAKTLVGSISFSF